MKVGTNSKSFWRLNFASKKSQLLFGVVLAFAGSAMDALADVIPKPLMAETQIVPTNPLMIVFLLYIINGIIFTPFTSKSPSVFHFPKKSLYLLLGLGIAEVFSTIFFLYGLKDTTAINASILGNSEIIFGLIIAMIILGERIKQKEILPFTLIGIGAIMLPLGTSISEHGFMTNFVIGDLMILISGFFIGIVMTLYKRMGDEFDSKRIIQITSFIGTGVALAGLLVMDMPFELNPEHLPTILVTGVLGIGLPIFFVIIAMRFIGAIRTILIFSTTSVFGIIFSNILLGETITLTNVASIGMVIIGTYVLRKKLAHD